MQKNKMAKRTKTYSFKKGDKIHVDSIYDIQSQLEIANHFEKIPDDAIGDADAYGNRNWEELSDIEQCTKSFKITIIIED